MLEMKRKSIGIIFALMLLAIIFSGCGEKEQDGMIFPKMIVDDFREMNLTDSLGQTYELTGILTVHEISVFLSNGPFYGITSSDRKDTLPLIGNISHDDHEKLGFVKGVIVKSDSRETHPFLGQFIALKVESYSTIGEINGDDVSDIVNNYELERFGFLMSRSSSNGFIIENDEIFFWIKITYFNQSETKVYEDVYYELWIHPITGEIVKEIDKINDFPVKRM